MATIDDYERGALIGSGGFADVYRATYLPAMRLVALKMGRDDAESRSRLRREIEVQCCLRHANILPILDWDRESYRWFATEIAEGNLGEIHDSSRLDEQQALRLLEEILSALGSAHRRGYVHRDLSPGNILRARGQWVLADWGYVSDPEALNLGRLTRTGTGGGTFTWAAPEMLRDAHRADIRADLYALGKIVAWLLTGTLPDIAGAPALPEAVHWKDYLARLTDEDPQNRFATAEQALVALGPVAGAVPRPELGEGAINGSAEDAASVALGGAVKRYLVAPEQRIRLDELTTNVTRQTIEQVTSSRFSASVGAEEDALLGRLNAYVACCRPVMHVLFGGCHWGEEQHEGLWTKCIQRIVDSSRVSDVYSHMLQLQQVPALLGVSAGALGASIARKYRNLAAVTIRPQWERLEEHPRPVVARINAGTVIDRDLLRKTARFKERLTPASEFLFESLRGLSRDVLVGNAEFEEEFDRFEVLMALLAVDAGGWAVGCYAWRGGSFGPNLRNGPLVTVRKEFDDLGTSWGPCEAGLFGGDAERVKSAFAKVVDIAKAVGGR